MGADGQVHLAVTVAPVLHAPHTVARVVAEVVSRLVGVHRYDDVVLAVHEIVANAIVHVAAAPVRIEVRSSDDGVHVDVEDRGGGFATPDDVDVDAAGREDPAARGRGLVIARALSDGWSAGLTATGHRVRLTYRTGRNGCAATGSDRARGAGHDRQD